MKNEKLKKQLIKLHDLKNRNIELLIEGKDRELTKDEIAITKSLFLSYSWNNFKMVKGFLLPKISNKSYIDFAFVELVPKQIIINIG